MKTSLLFILLTLALSSYSQNKKAKLYAYQRETSAGVRAAEVDMEGNMKTSGSRNTSYLIYLEIPRGRTYKIHDIWINGEAYEAKADTVTTPVMVASGIRSMEDQELVPPTTGLVLRLIPGSRLDITSKARRRYANGRPVAVHFSLGNRSCRRSVDKITVLPPRVME